MSHITDGSDIFVMNQLTKQKQGRIEILKITAVLLIMIYIEKLLQGKKEHKWDQLLELCQISI